MIVDVQNEIRSYVKTALGTIDILSAYPDSTPSFPVVILTESVNTVDEESYDSAGEQYNQIEIQIEIFTYGSAKKTEALGIRRTIDTLLSGTYRMRRTFSNEIPNYADREVYRYGLRYSFKIDKNKQIYRG